MLKTFEYAYDIPHELIVSLLGNASYYMGHTLGDLRPLLEYYQIPVLWVKNPTLYPKNPDAVKEKSTQALQYHLKQSTVKQSEVARELGLSRKTISRYINEESLPSLKTARKIINWLGLSYLHLLHPCPVLLTSQKQRITNLDLINWTTGHSALTNDQLKQLQQDIETYLNQAPDWTQETLT